MAKWIQFQLNEGRVDGTQVVGLAELMETRSSQVARTSPDRSMPQYPYTEDYPTYGLGWDVGHYRGRLKRILC